MRNLILELSIVMGIAAGIVMVSGLIVFVLKTLLS
jgi:hypothetical protein